MQFRDPGSGTVGSGIETVRIRDGKKSDPGSGINIPDPQDCLFYNIFYSGHKNN
jgi:hypothetical protein